MLNVQNIPALIVVLFLARNNYFIFHALWMCALLYLHVWTRLKVQVDVFPRTCPTHQLHFISEFYFRVLFPRVVSGTQETVIPPPAQVFPRGC